MGKNKKNNFVTGIQINVEHSQNVRFGDLSNTVESGGLTIGEAFQPAYALLRASEPNAKELQDLLSLLQVELEKGTRADGKTVENALIKLRRMAPEIWEVLIDTFSNPVKGLSTVVLKVLEKAREDGM